jgi:hypothetical protein
LFFTVLHCSSLFFIILHYSSLFVLASGGIAAGMGMMGEEKYGAQMQRCKRVSKGIQASARAQAEGSMLKAE